MALKNAEKALNRGLFVLIIIMIRDLMQTLTDNAGTPMGNSQTQMGNAGTPLGNAAIPSGKSDY